MNLTSVVFVFLILFSASSFSSCLENFKKMGFQNIVEQETCSLNWKENNESHTAQVVFQKQGCSKLEGSEPEDCYHVIYCINDSEPSISLPVFFSDKPYTNKYCTYSKPQLRVLLGSTEEPIGSAFSAAVNCHKNEVVSIVLNSSNKLNKVCKLK